MIVDAGDYLGELQFNTDSFEITTPIGRSAVTPKSVFAVMSANTAATGANKLIPIVSHTDTGGKSYIFISNNHHPFNNYAISVDGNAGDQAAWYSNGTLQTFSTTGNMGNFGAIVSGQTMLQTIIYTLSDDPATTVTTIGKQGETQANGTFKELIIYSSDQSANRPAIEANINNQHNIYS